VSPGVDPRVSADHTIGGSWRRGSSWPWLTCGRVGVLVSLRVPNGARTQARMTALLVVRVSRLLVLVISSSWRMVAMYRVL
jgi:hypothetical protein